MIHTGDGFVERESGFIQGLRILIRSSSPTG
jgi:hypothetical protein